MELQNLVEDMKMYLTKKRHDLSGGEIELLNESIERLKQLQNCELTPIEKKINIVEIIALLMQFFDFVHSHTSCL